MFVQDQLEASAVGNLTPHPSPLPVEGRGRECASRVCASVLIFLFAVLATSASGQTTYSVKSSADAFLATGSPSNPSGTNLAGLNFGAAGALFIAPESSVNGEFQSILGFDLSGASNVFNAAYGTNDWNVTGISLTLRGNNGMTGEQPMNLIFPPISGGNFVIEWLSNNGWAEGTGTPITPTMDGVTYDSLTTLQSGPTAILSTNTYTPPGDFVPVTYPLPFNSNVVAEIMNGAQASFLLYAADNQIGYLFNSTNFGRGDEPLMNVAANYIPPRIVAGYFTNGGFQLIGSGLSNLSYSIQANGDLTQTNWQTLGAVSADGAGVIQFNDTNAAAQSGRFYRVVK